MKNKNIINTYNVNKLKSLFIVLTAMSVINFSYALNAVSTSTKSYINADEKALNLEIEANYSEIVGLKDCAILEKRVISRIDKVTDILDKESKSVNVLTAKLTAIASDTRDSGDATSTDILTAHISSINDKLDLVSTTSDKYVKELRAIETIKCQAKPTIVKSQILSTKPYYKDLIIADNNLKKYIKVDIKQTLIALKQDNMITASTTSPTQVSSTTTTPPQLEKSDDKNLWGIVKGLFR